MDQGKLRSLMFHAGFCNEDGGWDISPIHEQGDNFKRFAELIVRECSKVIRQGGFRRGAFGNEDLRPSEIATMIEEHFGVEE